MVIKSYQKSPINIILLSFLCVLTFSFCYAQKKPIKFEQIGINEGLSQNTVRCIFQDKKGFMWFGTKDGLNRYDGYKFTTFKKNSKDVYTLASNDIKSIIDDKNGNLWIATWDGGLNTYNPKTDRFKRFLKKDKGNSISSNFLEILDRDDQNNIWIGTADSGLDYLETSTGRFKNFRYNKNDPNSLSDNNVSAILIDRKKNIWIGTANGLDLFKSGSGSFKKFLHDVKNPQSISGNHIKFIYEDKKGNLWIGTYENGLNKFDINKQTFTTYNKANSNLKSDALLSIAEDENGSLWVGTEHGGVNVLDTGSKRFSDISYGYNDPNSISSNTINAIYKDKKGDMWLGTLNGGINLAKRDNRSFLHYKHELGKNSLINNVVTSIFEDSKRNLWIATDGGGLDLFDRSTGTFKNFRHNPHGGGLSGNYVLTVSEDNDGNLWIGTWGDGITVYNYRLGTFTNLKNIPGDNKSLSNNYAFYIFKDSSGNMWVGTYGGGLNRYNAISKSFTRYNHNDKDPFSISSDNILTLNEDHDHHILIGTDGAGLSILNLATGKCTSYKNSGSNNKLSNNSIGSIYCDKQNNIWLTTNDGLDKINIKSGAVSYYFKENGLPSNMIFSLLPDRHNNFWITTDNGLSKFDPGTKTFKNYTQADGLQSNEFKYARCLSKSGQMYFGGINGFNEFYPDSIADLNFDPPIVFTDFQIFNKHVDLDNSNNDTFFNANIAYTSSLRLSYKQSVLTFEFASLNYVNKEKKQYAYILEGFDTQWHHLGTKNNLTYTNLDPGTYTLKIKGLNNGGHVSAKTAQIQIIITPPYWKTWWFRLGMLIAVIAGVIVIFYLRVNRIKTRNRQLETEVTKRTLELKETNQTLIETNKKIKEQNDKLEVFNKEVIDKSNEIIKHQEHILVQNTNLENTIQQLEKSNTTKDKFLSILAHDLRNPIAAIAGITKSMKTQLAHLNKIEIGRYISTVSDSSKSVLDLLLNLLDWAKTQGQTLKAIPENVKLLDIIATNQMLMEQLMRDKNIYLTINVNQEHTLFADKKMVETIIRNLLSNSIKFTAPYGHISIESVEKENEVVITFYDTGVGMSKEQIDNLFNLDTTTSSAGSNGETGSGLGLIIVKEFVEANTGTVTVNSMLNEGSTFTITLPKGIHAVIEQQINAYTIAYEDIHTEKLVDQKKLKLQGKRLLYIDDNADMRAYLQLILSPTFEMIEAKDGQEGIKAAIEFQPEIIITDMLMPVLNGLELCRKLKHNPLTSHIPIILLTSQTDIENQLQGYEAGADAYLMKPVIQKLLFQVIYNLINSRNDSRAKFIDSEEMYPDNFTYNARDKDFIDKVIAFIEANIAQPNLDHKNLCNLMGMSRTILYAKIKTLTGLGVHEFIQSIRVKKGLKLLMEGRLNINQISYEVGFNTASYFSKCFLKQFGMPPREYLSRLQQNLVKEDSK